MATTAQRGSTQPKYKVIGTRPIRQDGVDKVTGRARYAADFEMPGMLHAKVLRSPHAHARIRSIDTSKAEALPGVRAVMTGKDFPIVKDTSINFGEVQGNARMVAENALALNKALYVGHAVAAVAADNPHIAEEALKLIKVDYEVLQPVFDVLDAMKPDAPQLHDAMTTRFRVEHIGSGKDTGQKGNIAAHVQFKRGDMDKGFQEASVIVEREFRTQTVHQGYIEPHASTVLWSQDGHVTVWTSTQGAFQIRSLTASILGIPEHMVKVVPLEIGGGFGAKLVTYLDPVAAILSRKTGRAVKMVMSRKEVFEGTGPTSATFIRCKIGADQKGKITAAEMYLAYEAGAFPGSPVGGGCLTAFGPYKVENLLVNGYDVVCNKQKVQAYRAPGQPQSAFAAESVIDELAEKLRLDPLKFRLMNVSQEGDRMPNGVAYPRIGCKEVEEAMMAHPHYKTPLVGPNRGRGISVGHRFNAGGISSATIAVNSDGTINLITGSVDIGGTRTSVGMQAAETLGLKIEDVIPTVVDTDSVGFTGNTAGSRITYDTGLAAIGAAEEVKKQMMARAAKIWEVQAQDVEFKDGVFTCGKNPSDKLSFKDLARRLMSTGGPITCAVSATSTGVGSTFGGNIVDVEVDPDTGKVTILRYTALIDAGTAVHPSYAEGQVQGATVQGIGWALNEEYFYTRDGVMANSSFLDYRMPTSLDVPMIDIQLVEVPNPRHPYGLRGVGEIPLTPVLAAVANAISHATGVRMTTLPMSPGAILQALEKAK
ncbi:MAG: xanthine dehydrogenase family protein molybdopterin-binding subunit [Dehalococcoidia bacterium]|nr:xanthine dehydrogenase family protein molybdopterin-binding subunit [Dehalococcoidia bacterium]MSQ17324.1 xanthine dehydrogenase family protein molybdopterin-binding subunit [Dehalococcoidia bacterium]